MTHRWGDHWNDTPLGRWCICVCARACALCVCVWGGGGGGGQQYDFSAKIIDVSGAVRGILLASFWYAVPLISRIVLIRCPYVKGVSTFSQTDKFFSELIESPKCDSKLLIRYSLNIILRVHVDLRVPKDLIYYSFIWIMSLDISQAKRFPVIDILHVSFTYLQISAVLW